MLTFTTRGRLHRYSRPVVMGILNITDDSFYDGGRYRQPDAMLAQAHRLLNEGADIIDLGASSSRPGATLLPPDEESRRLTDALRLLRDQLPDAIISVDTCYAAPARAAIQAGADIINDIGGFDIDPDMAHTIAELQVPYILMHGGLQHVRRQKPFTADGIVDTLVQFFSAKLDVLYRLGVKDVWLDPGFGFAKGIAANHHLLHHLDALTTLFREPLLAALSRKRMVFEPLGITPADALHGTIALDTVALLHGASLLRVHDPRPARQTIDLLQLNKQ